MTDNDEIASLRSRIAKAGYDEQPGLERDATGLAAHFVRGGETVTGQGPNMLAVYRDAWRQIEARRKAEAT